MRQHWLGLCLVLVPLFEACQVPHSQDDTEQTALVPESPEGEKAQDDTVRQEAARVAIEIQRRRGQNRPINLKVGIDSEGRATACEEVAPADPSGNQGTGAKDIEPLCELVLKWRFKSPAGQKEVALQFGSSYLK